MRDTKCTHCHISLICRADDIKSCNCQKIVLQEATIQFLKDKTDHDCLCNDCLKKFDTMMQYSKDHPFPKRPTDLVENVHYYMENGFFVFTELYHFLKGRCCKNGCRHCVYGIHK